MSSYSYEYDESGLASSYLALSFIIPLTAYFTYYILTTKRTKRLNCKCQTCKNIPSCYSYKKLLITSLLWLILSYFVYNVRTIKMENKKTFNPLEVLQVDANIKKKDLKKILMKLLKKYNSKRVPEEQKEEYEQKKIEINKAYDIIKNKDKFNLWLNTESKVGEIMAIPTAVLKNSFLSFAFYCLILGVCLPHFAYYKWKNMRHKNVHGVDFDTMETFMNFLNDDFKKKNNSCMIRSLIYLLSKSKELSSYDFKNMEIVKDIVEHEYGFPVPDIKNVNYGYLAIMCHLFRLNKLNSKDHKYLITVLFKLIESLKYVAISRGFIEVIKNLYTLQAMITQAVFDEEYFMLQYPFVEFKKIFLLKMQNEKINFDNLLNNDYQRSIAENIKNKIPKIKIEEFIAVVKNTGTEAEDSDDHEFIMKTEQSTKSNNAIFNIERNSKATIKVVVYTTNNEMCVHSNVDIKPIYNSWTAFLTVDGILNKDFVVIKNENTKKELYFDFYVSSKKNSCEVKLWILNGQYLCNNVEEAILLKFY